MKIVLEHLTKRYPNRNKKIKEDVVAVHDFTFEIPISDKLFVFNL